MYNKDLVIEFLITTNRPHNKPYKNYLHTLNMCCSLMNGEIIQCNYY